MARTAVFRRAGRLTLLAALACIAGKAGAAMPGLYFAGFYMDSALAYSTVDAGLAGFDREVQDLWIGTGFDIASWDSEITDKTDIGYGFSLGYQFSQYLAAEVGYVDMGTVHYSATGVVSEGGNDYRSDTFMSAKSKGPLLSAIGIWPMGDRFSLDARAGIFFGRTRMRGSAYLESGFLGDASEKTNSTTLNVGAGVNFSMSPGTAIRVGYSRFSKAMIDEYDVSSWVLSLKYAW